MYLFFCDLVYATLTNFYYENHLSLLLEYNLNFISNQYQLLCYLNCSYHASDLLFSLLLMFIWNIFQSFLFQHYELFQWNWRCTIYTILMIISRIMNLSLSLRRLHPFLVNQSLYRCFQHSISFLPFLVCEGQQSFQN